MQRRSFAALLALACAFAPFASPPAAAQGSATSPGFDHAVRVIVPFAPGGTSDILARILAPELTRSIGQPVVVENRPGAAGNIGADAVAKSAPDGHTLLLIDAGILATAPSLFTRLPFDVKRDLAPVSMLIYAPYIVAVHPSLPAQDAAGLVAYAKAHPGRINAATSGIGGANHLAALVLAGHWATEVMPVPYRGGSAALAAVAAGEANLIVNGATATQPFVTSGQLRGIAVSGPRRLAALPLVPTFAELGWPAQESGTYQGVLAAGGTPPALLARWEREFRAALAQPAIAARIAELGGEPRVEGGEAFGLWLDRETENWRGVIRAARIQLD
ncbi:tripartite tricarboxylate transporter substrate binding protein [Pseudoroseomonas cervicalis]|uniref:Bug family tripartite tricarboxylate transporter substrate binding protein n=1 Tax=Teichococcus cervicalis TaxID=204525 RepID=UPI0022F1C960|nr:tripartite tricarboxylate transporter substrate-binding protein [Pseudoroseomonas cervicalis]WBV43536.1 tripartite tricarboxylate transporter substrate-binding protein [Pseudoroseomonas cervicalis]